MSTITLSYGKSQVYASKKMSQAPGLAKILFAIVGYTNIGNYARAEVFKRQLKTLPLSTFKKVMDLGCGRGENATMMASGLKNAEIVALDIRREWTSGVESLARKMKLNNLTTYTGFSFDCPEKDFDFIYSVDVFEHIPVAQMPFSDCYAKLKIGGYLMVKMPVKEQYTILNESNFEEHNEWLKHEHPGQVYTLEDLKERFLQEGFEVVLSERTDGPLARLAWEISYLAKKKSAILQLAVLPFAKALVAIDNLTRLKHSTKGNAITVIGKK